MVDILKAKTDASGFTFQLVAETKEQFLMGMILAFNGQRASHFAISPSWGMLFLAPLEDYQKGIRDWRPFLPPVYEPVEELRQGPTINDIRYKEERVEFVEKYGFQYLGSRWNAQRCAEKAWSWLTKEAKYLSFHYSIGDIDERLSNPHEYDNDSDMSNHEGYEISTDSPWAHHLICRVRPRWLQTGK